MNVFKSLGVLLLLSFLVSACDYNEKFELESIQISNMYPELGETVTIDLIVQSETYSTTDVRVYLNEGYFRQFLYEEEIYISKGENKFNYEVRVPVTIGHNMALIEFEMGNKRKYIPIYIENEHEELIHQEWNEENYTLKLDNDLPVKFRIEMGNVREINVRPVNGTVNLNIDICEDCEMLISFDYLGEKFNIYNVFGNYVRPYVRISNIEEKQVEVVSCPLREIDIVRFETGYETITSDGHSFDLSKFSSEEINEIEILGEQPLIVLVKAYDELGRDVYSKGNLLVECDFNTFIREVEFFGKEEFQFNIDKNTTCNVSYGEIKKDTTIIEKEKIVQEEEEIIYWDDYVIYGLIVLAILVMGLLFNKWRSMNKR
jgi:hypothetical protein